MLIKFTIFYTLLLLSHNNQNLSFKPLQKKKKKKKVVVLKFIVYLNLLDFVF